MQKYEWHGRRVVFWRSARRHKIGKGHVMAVMDTSLPEILPAADGADGRLRWQGADDRGLSLEVVALDETDRLVVIHAMPLAFRGRRLP